MVRGPGRAAIAPEVLFALWLYATLEGLGSARALANNLLRTFALAPELLGLGKPICAAPEMAA